jgi:hypothetical protein
MIRLQDVIVVKDSDPLATGRFNQAILCCPTAVPVKVHGNQVLKWLQSLLGN